MSYKQKQCSRKTSVMLKESMPQPVIPSLPLSHRQQKNEEYAYYTQIIKSIWTHEPWKYFTVVCKSVDVMGEYIALHGLVPQNELPESLRHKIPENEIWMREDIYSNVERRKRILTHEYVELDLMITYSMSYKEAHVRAEYYEDMWYEKI